MNGQPTSTDRTPPSGSGVRGIHPVIFKAILFAAIWYLAAVVLLFAWDSESAYLMGVVSVFVIIATGVVIIPASYTLNDPRWSSRTVAPSRFLDSRIPIATGSLTGAHAAVQILLLPVGLALAVTVIGLIWSVTG